MGRPLRTEWTKDITVHCYEETNGSLVDSKLIKQVGYNKYKNENGIVIRLGDKAEVEEAKLAGTGYVVVTDIEKGEEKSLFKLTKHQAVTTDGSVYFIAPEAVIDEEGTVTGIKLPADSEIAIEGLTDEESSS